MNCSADSIPASKLPLLVAPPLIEAERRFQIAVVQRPAIRAAQQRGEDLARARQFVLSRSPACKRKSWRATACWPGPVGSSGPSTVSRSTEGSPVMSRPSMVVRRKGLIRSSFSAWLLRMVDAAIECGPAFSGMPNGQPLVEIRAEIAGIRGHLDEIVVAAGRHQRAPGFHPG